MISTSGADHTKFIARILRLLLFILPLALATTVLIPLTYCSEKPIAYLKVGINFKEIGLVPEPVELTEVKDTVPVTAKYIILYIKVLHPGTEVCYQVTFREQKTGTVFGFYDSIVLPKGISILHMLTTYPIGSPEAATATYYLVSKRGVTKSTKIIERATPRPLFPGVWNVTCTLWIGNTTLSLMTSFRIRNPYLVLKFIDQHELEVANVTVVLMKNGKVVYNVTNAGPEICLEVEKGRYTILTYYKGSLVAKKYVVVNGDCKYSIVVPRYRLVLFIRDALGKLVKADEVTVRRGNTTIGKYRDVDTVLLVDEPPGRYCFTVVCKYRGIERVVKVVKHIELRSSLVANVSLPLNYLRITANTITAPLRNFWVTLSVMHNRTLRVVYSGPNKLIGPLPPGSYILTIRYLDYVKVLHITLPNECRGVVDVNVNLDVVLPALGKCFTTFEHTILIIALMILLVTICIEFVGWLRHGRYKASETTRY